LQYIIGIDTGGTFTDSVAVDDTGKISWAKALSTPPHFEEGIFASLEALARDLGLNIESLLKNTGAFCLGTTVATNALWTRSGSKIGLLVTKGFEDTHHIGRGVSKWAGLPESLIKHQSVINKPEALVTKDCIVGISERTDWQGTELFPLDRQEVERAIERLREKHVSGIAIGYLWSIKNPSHERETMEIISAAQPDLYCSCSSAIVPSLGEYERFNNAIIDSYIGPVTKAFLGKVTARLKTTGLGCDVMTMKADGGSALVSSALPLATIHSGPAAGVLCAQYLGGVLGHANVITADVGGTSFDVSLIREGTLSYTREPVLERFSCNYPSLAVKSIGAGGGSIVSAEPVTKTIKVGPKSAGSYPGPACYGFGGSEPTVSDANLILGYLSPHGLLGGRLPLSMRKAEQALAPVAESVGLSVHEAAAAVYDLMNAHCTDLIREMTVQHGYDPRDFVLYAFGGAGPAHAIAWALELGCKSVVIMPYASAYSALGIAISDVTHTEYLYDQCKMPVDGSRFNSAFATLEDKLQAVFAREATQMDQVAVRYFLHCKYPTMYSYVRVPIERRTYKPEELETLVPGLFDREYERLYGRGSAYTTAGREIVGFEIQGIYKRPKPKPIKSSKVNHNPERALIGERPAYFRDFREFRSTPIYHYDRLESGNEIKGPCIVEALDTTVVIPPKQMGHVDQFRNIIIDLS